MARTHPQTSEWAGSKDRLWYKIIRPHDLMAICQVKVLADVSNFILYGLDYTDMPQSLFIRNVDIDRKLSLDPVFDEVVEWDTPDPPAFEFKNCYRANRTRWLASPARVRQIPLRQGVRGTVAAHDPVGLVTLHAWYEESDPK